MKYLRLVLFPTLYVYALIATHSTYGHGVVRAHDPIGFHVTEETIIEAEIWSNAYNPHDPRARIAHEYNREVLGIDTQPAPPPSLSDENEEATTYGIEYAD